MTDNRIGKQGVLLLILLVAGLLLQIGLPTRSYADSGEGSILVNLVPTLDSVTPKGVHMELYQLAAGNPLEQEAEFTKDFADCGVSIRDLTDDPAVTIAQMDQWIADHDIAIIQEGETNGAGMMHFDGLPDGIYYLVHTNPEEDIAGSYKAQIKSSVVTVPYMEDGKPTRDVICNLKCRIIREDTEKKTQDLTIEKHWQDDNDRKALRPAKIQVGLYCDGELVEKVWLSAADNWQHTFTGLSAEGDYTAKEMKVPMQYKMSVTREDTTFIITNSLTGQGDNPPDDVRPPVGSVATGDSAKLLLAAVAMTAALVLMALVIISHRKRRKN